MSMVSHAAALSDAEWQLVIELLRRESRELPIEIHHSRTRRVRADVKHRMEVVENLLERLQPSEKA